MSQGKDDSRGKKEEIEEMVSKESGRSGVVTIEASERDEVSASRCPGGRRVASGRVALVFTSANGKIIVEGGIKDTVVKDGPLYVSTRCIHVKAGIALLPH